MDTTQDRDSYRLLGLPLRGLVAAVVVSICLLVGVMFWMTDSSEPQSPRSTTPSLRLSDPTVETGDVVELNVSAPPEHTWGVMTAVRSSGAAADEFLFYWRTWPGASERPLRAQRPGSGSLDVEAIGFGGDASFLVRIPRLQPGQYVIAKTFVTKATPGKSLAERSVTAEATFSISS